MKSRRSDVCWPGPQHNDLASNAAVWMPLATEMCVMPCHHFVMLCPAPSCGGRSKNGSYSRISACIFPTSQQLNGSLQNARKCPDARIQSWKWIFITGWCHDPMKKWRNRHSMPRLPWYVDMLLHGQHDLATFIRSLAHTSKVQLQA